MLRPSKRVPALWLSRGLAAIRICAAISSVRMTPVRKSCSWRVRFTVLTEINDLASGHVWPGAVARVQRNAFVARWAGREWALRQNQPAAAQAVAEARRTGDVDNAPLMFGQDAGLIDSIKPAAEIISGMAKEADDIIRRRLSSLLRD